MKHLKTFNEAKSNKKLTLKEAKSQLKEAIIEYNDCKAKKSKITSYPGTVLRKAKVDLSHEEYELFYTYYDEYVAKHMNKKD